MTSSRLHSLGVLHVMREFAAKGSAMFSSPTRFVG